MSSMALFNASWISSGAGGSQASGLGWFLLPRNRKNIFSVRGIAKSNRKSSVMKMIGVMAVLCYTTSGRQAVATAFPQ